MKKLALLVVFQSLLAGHALAQQVQGCGNLQNAFGPFDYRDPTARRESLRVVETFHFTPEVEALRAGKSGHFLGDIDYTLRAFPNHHRALASISRYALLGGKQWVNVEIPSVDCYFLRAIAFRSDDAVVRIQYGNLLFKRGEKKDAREQYDEALRIDSSSPEISYNAALYFLQIDEVEKAKELAKVAYDQGYPLPGLKNKLDALEAAKTNSKK